MVLCFKFASEAVIAAAGKTTVAGVMIDGKFHASVDKIVVSLDPGSELTLWAMAILAAVAIGGILYGKREAALRRNAIAHFHTQIAQLERQLDPMRSSSKLTARGDTREEDQ